MTARSRSFALAALAAVALGGQASQASAGCDRRIVNRSGYDLVVSQDGSLPFTVRRGRTASIRLAQPGSLDVTATCGVPGAPAEEIHLSYEAVLDRCYYEIGYGFFEPQLGRGFFGTRNTGSFAANNPRQGDLTVGPVGAACPAVR